MATAKPKQPSRAGPRRHRLRNSLLAVVLLAVVGTALLWHHLLAQAGLAVAYGARIGCTCHYIEGRDLKDCRKDFEPGMALVTLSDNGAHGITARVPLVAVQTATFREGAGCLLPRWTP